MRAIMMLDDATREKIVHINDTDENFDHLKIECRAKDKPSPHQTFGELLFRTMKSVTMKNSIDFILNSFCLDFIRRLHGSYQFQ